MDQNILVVGSMQNADAFQDAVLRLKAQQGGQSQVRAEMVDRILDQAAILESDTYDRALLLISAIDLSHHLSSLLPLLSPALRSNGSIDIQASDAALSSRSTLESAGWLNIQSSDPSSLTATKPAPSASVPLRLKRPSANGGKKKSSIWATSPAPSTPTIEESSLLTPEDLKRRDVIQKPDCDVKRTRKACKDCTCGLREILLDEDSDLKALQAARASALPVQTDAKSGKQIVNTGAMSSSCGNCSLGDAFRCASCPYLGMPSFEPGAKVELGATSFGGDDLP